jgi:hypothetical protein
MVFNVYKCGGTVVASFSDIRLRVLGAYGAALRYQGFDKGSHWGLGFRV